jgi:hypothetical protein
MGALKGRVPGLWIDGAGRLHSAESGINCLERKDSGAADSLQRAGVIRIGIRLGPYLDRGS